MRPKSTLNQCTVQAHLLFALHYLLFTLNSLLFTLEFRSPDDVAPGLLLMMMMIVITRHRHRHRHRHYYHHHHHHHHYHHERRSHVFQLETRNLRRNPDIRHSPNLHNSPDLAMGGCWPLPRPTLQPPTYAAAATAAALERAWVHEKEEGSPGSIEGDVRSRAGLADLSDAADFWRGLITDLSDAELDNLALTVGEQQARRRRPKRGGLSPQREGGREEG